MPADGNAARRLVLIGAECTGKSTLAKALAAELGEPWSSEYVREHVERLDRPLNESDLEPIARGQMRLEDEAYARAERFVIHDTNLLSSILYAKYYFDTRIAWVDEAFERREYYRYFLCEPDIPWVADPGQREGPEVRETLQKEFVSILEGRGIPYVRLSGGLDDRVRSVLSACER